jgi:protein TonB
VAVDVIALRSGVPENLPGRCTDLSEGGVGGMVAGDLVSGQQVAIELRLPNLAVPVRARALVRYHGRLRCGFEFVGLSVEQQEMIRYWAFRLAPRAVDLGESAAKSESISAVERRAAPVRRRRVNLVLAAWLVLGALVILGGIGWWHWQRSWNELEIGANAISKVPLHVAPETMEMRTVSKVDPVYPEEARQSGKQGMAVLDAVIAPDGSVMRLKRVSGDELFVASAEKAVRSWRFEPFEFSGQPVAVETTIAVEFRLN